MNKIKRNFGLLAAIVSVLLLTWGNINAQTTMPVTMAFDVVGYLNGNSLNDSYIDIDALMSISTEDGSWKEYFQQRTLEYGKTGDISYPIDWHPTANYDLVFGQKYYFEWMVRVNVKLEGDGAAAGQFDWNLSGVGSSSGAQWLEQNYTVVSWVVMYSGDYVYKYSSDPLHATASVSFYNTSLSSSARLGSSLLDIVGHAEMPSSTGFWGGNFFTESRGKVLFQPVPEPASLVLLGAGVLGLGVVGWYRRRRKD